MAQQFQRVHTAFPEDPSSVHNTSVRRLTIPVTLAPEVLMYSSYLYGYLYSHEYPAHTETNIYIIKNQINLFKRDRGLVKGIILVLD